jgi:large subunit ribosomal protein L29
MAEKTNKLRELSTQELSSRLNDAREELMNLRIQQATGELTDYNRLRYTRRQVARIMTLLSERQQTAMAGGEE